MLHMHATGPRGPSNAPAAAPADDTPKEPRKPPLAHCRECGAPFYLLKADQAFCGVKCRQTFHKRRYERGAQLYDFAMEWRGKRLKGGFTQLCRIIDDWLREDRERAQARSARIKSTKGRG
jgi:predicted nucleic acid-binding Zn ribbon protein